MVGPRSRAASLVARESGKLISGFFSFCDGDGGRGSKDELESYM